MSKSDNWKYTNVCDLNPSPGNLNFGDLRLWWASPGFIGVHIKVMRIWEIGGIVISTV